MAFNFFFSLEKVLKVRNIREDKALNQFVQARNKEKKIQNKLQNKISEQKDLYKYIRNNDLPPETAFYTRNCIFSKRKKINNVQEQLSAQKMEVKKCKQEFIEKRKKREAIDKLKEKEIKSFTKKFHQKEQKELDDIAQHLNSEPGV